MSPEQPAKDVWWSISGEAIMAMLRRVNAGDDPDMVYLEEYANSGHEFPAGET